jgi:hypothetical protein
MNDKRAVTNQIKQAFGENEYPGDGFLQGSFEGCEPYDEIAPFKGIHDWQNVASELLDAHHAALSFFSAAGLRFFLPAYLVADLRDELETADPLFVLVRGFSDASVEHRVKGRVFVRKIGKSAFVNPRRYGGMTFYDYARWRLSIFTRQEAQAIVAYLRFKRDTDPHHLRDKEINAALDLFWLERAENAPPATSLQQHLEQEQAYLTAINSDANGSN